MSSSWFHQYSMLHNRYVTHVKCNRQKHPIKTVKKEYFFPFMFETILRIGIFVARGRD